MSLPIDVVVVTHRSEAHLADCLAALPAVASVTVVDNGAHDEAPVIARRSGAFVIENATNRGFGAAANQGLRVGEAPYVLFLNPDAEPDVGCLEALADALDGDRALAFVGPRLVGSGGSEQRPSWPFPTAAGSWAEALGLHRLTSPAAEGFVVGACLLTRRSVVEAAGGFDESYWLYGEEADLQRRAIDAGARTRLVPTATCRHVGGASSIPDDPVVFEHFQLGTERFLLQHRGPASLLSHRLALLTGSTIRVLLLSLSGRGRTSTARTRRRIARRLVHTLGRTPLSLPADTPVVALRQLVVLSLEPWDDVWRRNQLLVRELLQLDPHLEVLFVEPPLDVLHHLRADRTWPRVGRDRPVGLHPRVEVFRPTKVLPRALGPLADTMLLRSLRRRVRKAGFDAPTLWVNDPSYAGVTDWRWPVLYDLTDDWTAAERPARIRARTRKWDDRLTRKASVVVACSAQLAESHGSRDVEVISNAVDVDHFRAPAARPTDLAPSPVAVYVGTLHQDRLDVDLVDKLASALPEVSFVFVGPDALDPAASSRLAANNNVDLLGPRPYAAVPAYLQHADVIVVPHVVTAFTESLDPIKAYECMAVGQPTVATPIAGFRGLPRPVRAVDGAGFADAVEAALESSPACEPSDVPTWTERGREFADALARARDRSTVSRRMSVVYLDHCAQLSGAELALLRLLPVLDVDAHVILGEDGPLVQRLRDVGATVEVMEMAPAARDVRRGSVRPFRLSVRSAAASVAYTWRIARRLGQLGPDLVHTNSLKAAYYGAMAARLAGRPVLVHVRDRVADDYLPRPAVLLTRALLRVLPSAVIANSRATLETLRLPGERGSVVFSPVVHDAVGPHPTVRVWRDRPTTIAMVGRLSPWKGQDVFLRSFAAAFPGGDERALVVGSALFGEDDWVAHLERLAVELELSERVELTGFQDDVARVLDEVDILVHASTVPEPFGQVVLEGMEAGLAVIATGVGGPAELISDGVDGVLVDPGDVELLAATLQELAHDPARRQQLGDAARVRAAEFRPDRIAAQMRSVYCAVVDTGGAGSTSRRTGPSPIEPIRSPRPTTDDR